MAAAVAAQLQCPPFPHQQAAHATRRALQRTLPARHRRHCAIADFDFHEGGVLQLFRTRQEFEMGRIAARALDEYGVPWHLLDGSDELSAIEPAMARSSVQMAGALHMPADASGDSYKFVNQLARFLQQRGVVFQYDTAIEALGVEGGDIGSVATSRGVMRADRYVLALGSHAPLLAAPLGLKLPVYPLKGYSITVPVTDPAAAVRMAVMDEHNKVMISRLGNRIRAAGMAELTGYSTALKPARKKQLMHVVQELFPVGLDMSRVEFWAGLRPMTPDGPPILGKTRWNSLYLNSGHGSNGWTQACGTGKIVADIVSGKQPDIDMEGLTIERFSRFP
jgi:D-amino-acid dehydrogenase